METDASVSGFVKDETTPSEKIAIGEGPRHLEGSVHQIVQAGGVVLEE